MNNDLVTATRSHEGDRSRSGFCDSIKRAFHASVAQANIYINDIQHDSFLLHCACTEQDNISIASSSVPQG